MFWKRKNSNIAEGEIGFFLFFTMLKTSTGYGCDIFYFRLVCLSRVISDPFFRMHVIYTDPHPRSPFSSVLSFCHNPIKYKTLFFFSGSQIIIEKSLHPGSRSVSSKWSFCIAWHGEWIKFKLSRDQASVSFQKFCHAITWIIWLIPIRRLIRLNSYSFFMCSVFRPFQIHLRVGVLVLFGYQGLREYFEATGNQ